MKRLKLILAIFLFTQLNFAQDKRIVTGVVFDSLNKPINAVNIEIKKTGIMTKTNFKGEYSIMVHYNDTIIFSFSGMKTRNINSGFTHKINVRLLGVNHVDEVLTPGPQIPKMKINRGYVCKLKSSPKYNFKYNSLRNNFIVYVNLEKTKDSLDLCFEKKYNIVYVHPSYYTKRYYKKHNKLTFKYLNKKYRKIWQSEIRKDVIGINKFL